MHLQFWWIRIYAPVHTANCTVIGAQYCTQAVFWLDAEQRGTAIEATKVASSRDTFQTHGLLSGQSCMVTLFLNKISPNNSRSRYT